VQLETQEELDLLGRLLQGRIANDRTSPPQPVLGKGMDAETAEKVLQLLFSITMDQWWERAWIFQEDYISGLKMQLLIRHSSGLSKWHARKELRDLPSEVLVNSAKFREYATLFILAYRRRMGTSFRFHNGCDKYNGLHRYEPGGLGGKICRAISSTIFADLASRGMTNQSNLLAISANCLDYSIRLDATNIQVKEQPESCHPYTLPAQRRNYLEPEERPRSFRKHIPVLGEAVYDSRRPVQRRRTDIYETSLLGCRI
jgi:hypothetical protein